VSSPISLSYQCLSVLSEAEPRPRHDCPSQPTSLVSLAITASLKSLSQPDELHFAKSCSVAVVSWKCKTGLSMHCDPNVHVCNFVTGTTARATALMLTPRRASQATIQPQSYLQSLPSTETLTTPPNYLPMQMASSFFRGVRGVAQLRWRGKCELNWVHACPRSARRPAP
jgi:hypothetical protein